jgi:hypothetical protein
VKNKDEVINIWKHITCSWIGRVSLKCPCYSKQSTDPLQCLSKFQWHFAPTQKKKNPQIYMETQKTLNHQISSWAIRARLEDHNTFLKIYYKVIEIKTVWY